MKKYIVLVLICALTLVVLLTGCKKTESVDESSYVIEQVVEEETHKTEADEQILTIEKLPESESLSAEDKAVKTEISKHIDTAVDFRYNKQEVLQDKTFDITFSELNATTNADKVIYKNNLGDEFKYDINTGELAVVKIDSAVTEKTNNSIDISTAYEIARTYVSKECNIDEYTVDVYEESEEGYVFWYVRYIGGYATSDAFRIKIGFDGSIVYFNNTTSTFAGKNLGFSKDFIDKKINETLGDKNIEVGTITINLHDNKVCVICSYTMTDESGGKSGLNTIIPLE